MSTNIHHYNLSVHDVGDFNHLSIADFRLLISSFANNCVRLSKNPYYAQIYRFTSLFLEVNWKTLTDINVKNIFFPHAVHSCSKPGHHLTEMLCFSSSLFNTLLHLTMFTDIATNSAHTFRYKWGLWMFLCATHWAVFTDATGDIKQQENERSSCFYTVASMLHLCWWLVFFIVLSWIKQTKVALFKHGGHNILVGLVGFHNPTHKPMTWAVRCSSPVKSLYLWSASFLSLGSGSAPMVSTVSATVKIL